MKNRRTNCGIFLNINDKILYLEPNLTSIEMIYQHTHKRQFQSRQESVSNHHYHHDRCTKANNNNNNKKKNRSIKCTNVSMNRMVKKKKTIKQRIKLLAYVAIHNCRKANYITFILSTVKRHRYWL